MTYERTPHLSGKPFIPKPDGMCPEHERIWIKWENHSYDPTRPQEWPGAPLMDSRTSHADRAQRWADRNAEQMRMTAQLCLSGQSPQCAWGDGRPDWRARLVQLVHAEFGDPAARLWFTRRKHAGKPATVMIESVHAENGSPLWCGTSGGREPWAYRRIATAALRRATERSPEYGEGLRFKLLRTGVDVGYLASPAAPGECTYRIEQRLIDAPEFPRDLAWWRRFVPCWAHVEQEPTTGDVLLSVDTYQQGKALGEWLLHSAHGRMSRAYAPVGDWWKLNRKRDGAE